MNCDNLNLWAGRPSLPNPKEFMTKTQKNTIADIVDRLEIARQDIEELFNELQEKYDSLSEKAQESERGQALQEQVSALEDALSETESAKDKLDQFTGEE